MTDRILMDIAGAEARAAELERQAAQAARDIVAQARQEARRALEQSTTDAEQRMKDQVVQHEQALAKAGQIKLETAEATLGDFRGKAMARMGAAVSIIVEGVVNAYGHR